ncbi:MAG: hypothetical protein P1V20_16090 [Verrucomicrobiales bacterium]|nr:hypothetical protein [Verrucomicrobiales bacterium]
MIKTISKIGNSHGLIFDSTLLQLAKLSPGDQVNVEVHSSGTITLTPLKQSLTVEDVADTIDSVMEEYSETMKDLAK